MPWNQGQLASQLADWWGNVKCKSFSLWEMTEPGVLLLQRKTAAVDTESLAFSLLHWYLGHGIRGSLFLLNLQTHLSFRFCCLQCDFSIKMDYVSGVAETDSFPPKDVLGATSAITSRCSKRPPRAPHSPWHRIPMLCGCLHHCWQRPSRSLMGAKAPRK